MTPTWLDVYDVRANECLAEIEITHLTMNHPHSTFPITDPGFRIHLGRSVGPRMDIGKCEPDVFLQRFSQIADDGAWREVFVACIHDCSLM